MKSFVNALEARLGLDMSEYMEGMRRADRMADRFATDVSRRFRRVATAVAAAGAAAVGLGVAFARSVIHAADTSEQLRLRMNALLGSVEEGSKAFAKMSSFAARVPFEFEEIIGSATQLAGIVKGGAEEIGNLMPIIADLAAVSGLSIQQTTEQIIRAFSAGIGSADLFRERGISAMLGFQAGASVSAEETRDRIIAAYNDAGSKFRGASEDLARTWTGLMSMLSDRWFQFRNLVAEAGLFDVAKGALDGLIESVNHLAETGELQAFAQRVSDAIVAGVNIGLQSIAKLLDAGASVIRFLDQNPAMTQMGLVGLMLFGPSGAVALGTFGSLIDKITEALYGSTTEFGKAAEKAGDLNAELERLQTRQNAVLAKIAEGADGVGGLADEWRFLDEQIAAVRAQLGTAETTLDGYTNRLLEGTTVGEGFASMLESMADRIRSFQEGLTAGGGTALGPSEETTTAAGELLDIQIRTLDTMKLQYAQSSDLVDRFKDAQAQAADIADTVGGQIGSAITNVVTGFSSVQDAVSRLGQAILRDIVGALVQATIKALIFKTVMSAFGFSTGGLGFLGMLYRQGGMIGAQQGMMLPMAAPAGFGGGIPILAHPGEAVLNREAVDRIGGPPTVHALNRGADEAGGMEAGAAVVIHGGVNLTLPNVTDAESLRRELPGALRDLTRRGLI